MGDDEESSPLVVETEAAASPMRYSHILRDGAAVEVAAGTAAGGVFLAWTLKRHVVRRDLDAVVATASNKRRLMYVVFDVMYVVAGQEQSNAK